MGLGRSGAEVVESTCRAEARVVAPAEVRRKRSVRVAKRRPRPQAPATEAQASMDELRDKIFTPR
jgi:hypothetical protein